MSHSIRQPLSAMMLPVADGGQRFALYHAPAAGLSRGAVLYLHPFAEEMNKVRRMAALQARVLAQAGFAVLQLDMRGCGDSSGDLSEVRWTDWVEDALAGARWLSAHHANAPLWFWGARAGCLVASAAASLASPISGLLFWMPTISGKTHLQQFLRIKLASQMLAGGSMSDMASLQKSLHTSGSVEIAGYSLTAAMAQGLSAAKLDQPPSASRIIWLDVSSRDGATLLPAAKQWLEACTAAGHPVDARVVTGSAFWQSAEIEVAPALLQATLDAMMAMATCP